MEPGERHLKLDEVTSISRDVKRALWPNGDSSLGHLGLEASPSGVERIDESLVCDHQGPPARARRGKRYPTNSVGQVLGILGRQSSKKCQVLLLMPPV